MIKLFQPYVSKKAHKYVKRVLESGQLAEGPMVKELEDKIGWGKGIAVNSGTSALELAYDLAGLKKGDEVLVPVLTCTATNVPLVRRGCKIVFVDVHPQTLQMDVHDLQRKISKKTKAVVYVSFGGDNLYRTPLYREVADKYGAKLIEDGAHSVLFGDNYLPGFNDITQSAHYLAFSFQAIKSITTGDGGMLFVEDEDERELARKLKWFGYDREAKQKFGDVDLDVAGYKYQMNDISAAIGLANYEDIDKITAHILSLREIYESYGLMTGWWLAWGFTDSYRAAKYIASNEGFEIGQHHYRNDKYTVFGGRRNDLPNMDAIEDRYFFVPMHMGVSKKQAHNIGKVCQNSLMK